MTAKRTTKPTKAARKSHNPFNPHGISLAEVAALLKENHAYHNIPEDDPFDLERVHIYLLRHGDVPAPARWDGHHIIHDGDGTLASEIRTRPHLLIVSPPHRDAMCRWQYAKRTPAYDSDILNLVTKLLDHATGRGRKSRSKKPQYSPDVIKEAYDAVYAYGEGIHAYLDAGLAPEKLLGRFPEGDWLERLDLHIRDFKKLNQRPPSASTMALTFIESVTTLSRTLINRYRKKAENAIADLRRRPRTPYTPPPQPPPDLTDEI